MTEASIRIVSDVAADGTFVASLEMGDDVSIPLTPEGAMHHAMCVLTAVASADYDAAIIRQLTTLGSEQESVVMLVRDLRADRPPIPWQSYQFEIVGGIMMDGAPYLAIMSKGEPVGQWSLDEGRVHAMGVLETVAVVDLDNAYYRALRSHIGLDEQRARGVVGDIEKHRSEQ